MKLNSITAKRAINARWEYYTHAKGETLKAASDRLGVPYRTLKRWKANEKIERRGGLWVTVDL
jgi:hypothetical protein